MNMNDKFISVHIHDFNSISVHIHDFNIVIATFRPLISAKDTEQKSSHLNRLYRVLYLYFISYSNANSCYEEMHLCV
jgi:hypothetical protein